MSDKTPISILTQQVSRHYIAHCQRMDDERPYPEYFFERLPELLAIVKEAIRVTHEDGWADSPSRLTDALGDLWQALRDAGEDV